MADNCNRQSPAPKEVQRVTHSCRKGKHTMIPSMWHACWPRTSKGHYRPAIALPRAAKRRQSPKKETPDRNDPSVYLVG
ncbi:hypothetical protein JTE90_020003 [Oedothorax gibbosus]|uniref:Uncharacterized protein n=1 Tax=Oedothorax gibbosus TaxID=931172 RepID=A0AAV6TFN2_9ARAC|nr:hypothetical protein JTE90_020003 [Oedothorax gibbosus]